MTNNSGTEYVNAQVEDLKDQIDEYAGKIAEMSSGAIYGMVWLGVFRSSDGTGCLVVWITGERYQNRNRFTLNMSGGFNTTPGYSRSIDTKIQKVCRPENNVTITSITAWSDYSPEVQVSAELTTSGVLRITVGDNADGQLATSQNYYHE